MTENIQGPVRAIQRMTDNTWFIHSMRVNPDFENCEILLNNKVNNGPIFTYKMFGQNI